MVTLTEDCIVGCLIGAVVATGSIALDVVIIDLLQVSSPLGTSTLRR